ncbi:putative ribonuclease H-like domain-containing protein, partial [Tanacetum coccineum]
LLAGVHDDVVAVTFPVHARCQSDKVNRKSSTTCLQKQAYILRLLTSMVYNIVRCLCFLVHCGVVAVRLLCWLQPRVDEKYNGDGRGYRLESTQNMMETTHVHVVFLTGQFTRLGHQCDEEVYLMGHISNLTRVVGIRARILGFEREGGILVEQVLEFDKKSTPPWVSLVLSVEYDDEDVGAEADLNNLETTMNVSPIPTTRIHKDHLKDQIIGDINSATQTRKMTKISEEHVMQCKKSFCNLNFKRFGHLVDLPKGKRDIGTKWVYKNKKAEKGIVARNKARLVAQGYTQEEGIDYDEKDRGDILLVQVYVDDIIFGSTKKSLCVEFEQMMHKRFQMSSIGELTFFLGLQIMQKDDGIFISQDKYVADILKKFDFVTVKTARTPIETNKALLKDEEA